MHWRQSLRIDERTLLCVFQHGSASWSYKVGWEVGIGHRWGHLTPLHNMIHGSAMYTTHVSLLARSHVTHTHIQAHTGDTYVHTRHFFRMQCSSATSFTVQCFPVIPFNIYHPTGTTSTAWTPFDSVCLYNCVKSLYVIFPVLKHSIFIEINRHLQAWSNNVCTWSCFKQNQNLKNSEESLHSLLDSCEWCILLY